MALHTNLLYAWRKLEDVTGKAYAGALHNFLRYNRINGFMAPREALKGRMLQVARDGEHESPIKALLSGLRVAEKMAVIQAIVVRGLDVRRVTGETPDIPKAEKRPMG